MRLVNVSLIIEGTKSFRTFNQFVYMTMLFFGQVTRGWKQKPNKFKFKRWNKNKIYEAVIFIGKIS